MSKGVILLAPGQKPFIIEGIEKRGYTVLVDSKLDVDVSFGTPVMKKVLIELKEVPRDLVSSMRRDGRLSRQTIALGANDGPSILMMIGEPEFAWQYDQRTGVRSRMLIDPTQKGPHRFTGLSYGELKLRELTLAMVGIYPMYVPDWETVPEILCEFYEQFQKKEHNSHLMRPNFVGAGSMESWPKPNQGDLILHIFQGFAGMGLKKSQDAWKYYGDLRTFAAIGALGENMYMKIPGIGKTTAKQIEAQMSSKYDEFFKK